MTSLLPPPPDVIEATPRHTNKSSSPPPLVFEHLRQVEGEVLQSHPAFSSSFYRSLLQSILENQGKAKLALATLQKSHSNFLNAFNDHVESLSLALVPRRSVKQTSDIGNPVFLTLVSVVAAAALLEEHYQPPNQQHLDKVPELPFMDEADDATVSTATTDTTMTASSEENEELVASMKRKVKRYKKKNKELTNEFASQRRALLELEKKYDLLKLEYAQEKAVQDESQAAAHEHLMEQDLQLLDLAHANDVLAADLAKTTAERDAALEKVEALEKAVIHRDLRRIELTNERDGLNRELKRSTKQRDAALLKVDDLSKERQELKQQVRDLVSRLDEARYRLKELGFDETSLTSQETDDFEYDIGPTATASRWMKKRILTRFPRRTRSKADEIKVVPV